MTSQLFFQKMACDLAPNCSFLFSYFSFNLPENTIGVKVTIHTLKGIHLQKGCTIQISKCSPWGSEVRPFLSLRKRIRDYIEERQAIAIPFNRSFPNRPHPSPFVKQPKASPEKKRTMSTKPRKVKVRNYTPINWVGWAFPTSPKATEAMPQASSVQTQQMEAPFTFTKPGTATAANTATTTAVPSPPITTPSQTQQRSNCCATCTPLTLTCLTQKEKRKIRIMTDRKKKNRKKRNKRN